MSALPSHMLTPSTHPCEQPLRHYMSTGLGSRTKVNLNLLRHIYFTPWHDWRTAHQLWCLMDRYPFSTHYPLPFPFPHRLLHDIMLDNSCMLYDAMSPNNNLGNTGDIASHMEGCNHFTTSKSLRERQICWILCGTAIKLFAPCFDFWLPTSHPAGDYRWKTALLVILA